MARFLLLIFFSLAIGITAVAQTSLFGKVTDEESSEPILFGSVALYKNGVLITGTETDFDGNYNFAAIDPGTYDVEVSYVGYQPKRIAGVKALAGKANKLDIMMSSGTGVVLDAVEVVAYEVPLVEQDNTTSGKVITSDEIKNLPTRNINALAATSAGLASADEGDALNVRGSRSNATDYYVDGIRVSGASNLVPESEIDQLQVITGGIEAQYGDVTGGIISITTKGPSSKFSGGIEAETSEYLDAFGQSLVGFNVSGPIIKRSDGRSILGFRLAGRYTYQQDDDPSAVPLYQITDESLARIEADPVILVNGTRQTASDFLTNDDVNIRDTRPNEEFRRYDLTAKLDARLSDAIDVTLTGTINDTRNRFTPGGWRLMNSQNNPYANNSLLRGNFRFRHRLGGNATGGGDDARAKKGSFIQNAVYTLQFGYEITQGDVADSRHGDNYFRYGHVGTFDIDYIPSFTIEEDPTGEEDFLLVNTDNRPILRSYTPSPYNPVLANFNNPLDIPGGEAINGQVTDFFLPDLIDPTTIVTREGFIAPNGFISQFTNAWNIHTQPGIVYNLAQNSQNELYTFNGNATFDILPGGSEKGRHSIQLGFWYEQRFNRNYAVAPRNLWDAGRQLINNHINGVDVDITDEGVIGTEIGSIDITLPGSEDPINAPIYSLDLAEQNENLFFRSVRDMLGVGLDTYVNMDGLNPDDLSLDMFSARELNDQGLIGYVGYDYLGNQFDGTFDDFFTERDPETGLRTFPVAPDRPIYQAFYIQDKFTFRDIIFRLGVRVDRFDANTRILKDPYSLYEIMGADDYHTQFGGNRPGNIGDDYKVYLDQTGDNVLAYRRGDDWFKSDGTPVNNFALAVGSQPLNPKYADPRVEDDLDFIKSEDFDPNVSFEDYEVQVNVMPRLAFSFPISTEANFFANYDILVQRPPSNNFASALSYFYFFETGTQIKNNPALRPERNINYEVGFQQKLTNASALKIAAFYKEMRDMIQERVFFPVPVITTYTAFDNIDFGTVKGFNVQYDLRRTNNIQVTANYALQFADGTGSGVSSSRGLTSRGVLRSLFPLSFDERHRLNLIVDYRYGSGKRYNGPRLFGKDIFANAGVNLQAVGVSGRPFTENLTPQEFGGSQIIGGLNGARKPWNFTLNLRVDKSFRIADKMNINVYARISNVLDRRNVLNVYPVTGSAEDDGFLQSSLGQDQLSSIQNSNRQVESYLASYQWRLLNPNFFSLPRRIFIGAIVSF
jgi:outer membrane receptor protein involved in Fe transport